MHGYFYKLMLTFGCGMRTMKTKCRYMINCPASSKIDGNYGTHKFQVRKGCSDIQNIAKWPEMDLVAFGYFVILAMTLVCGPCGSREVEKWQFPSSCTLAGDGQGGIWVLCDGALWHANLDREKHMYDNYPLDSKMTGDGQGGVWVLKEDTLWHANLQRQKLSWDYPETSDLEGDGQGGVWIFCRSNGTHAIWHATCRREVEIYECPKRLKLASDSHGVLWILVLDRLIHLSLPEKIVVLYEFLSSAKLVRAVET